MKVDAVVDAIRALAKEEQMELFARLALQYPEQGWSDLMIERDLLTAKARADART